MAWSSEFLRELSSRIARPIYLLEGYRWGTASPNRVWAIGSTEIAGARAGALIDIEGASVDGTEIDPRSWQPRFGGFVVPFLGTPGALGGLARRGQLVVLKMGFPGWPPDSFERIAIGVLANVTGTGSRFFIECRDFASYLQDRKTTVAAGKYLFSGLFASTTTLSSGYTAGDTTVNVASTALFAKQDDGSGTLKGGFLITPSSGDPFILTYTGTTGTSFTGVSTTGQAGTTAVSASSADVVSEIVWIDDHPIDAVRRILVSTGTALTNGAYDTLPETWGFAIPKAWIDDVDCDRFRNASSVSGSDDWSIVATDPQEDGLAWLLSVISVGGYWIALRQGSITVRAALEPNLIATAMTSTAPIVDADISEVISYQAWDSAADVEYQTVTVQSATDSTVLAGPLSTYPAAINYQIDVSTVVADNESNIRDGLLDRLAPWLLRVWQVVELEMAGLRWAYLAPGDVVEVSSLAIPDRSAPYWAQGRRALVAAVSPEWFGRPVVRLRLLVLPRASQPGS